MVGAAVLGIWALLALLGAGATLWLARRVWTRRKSLAPGVQVAAAAVALAVVFGAFGTVIGLVKAVGAVGGESVDPSLKARILAEGISEAMNCTAFALVLWLPGAVVLVVMLKRKTKPP